MRIVTNEPLVKRNRAWATRLFFFSLTLLVMGFVFANGSLLGIDTFDNIDPNFYLTVMPIILSIGLLATMFSVRMTNLWVRLPRPEDALEEGLKGSSAKNVLFNYHHLPARHVLIGPKGIFVITTRFQDGQITVNNTRWRQRRSPLGYLFALFRFDGIGDPFWESDQAIKYLNYLVEDYDSELEIKPLVIFIDPRVTVTITDPKYPVLYADPKREPSLRDYLRDQPNHPKLSQNAYLEEFLAEFEAATLD